MLKTFEKKLDQESENGQIIKTKVGKEESSNLESSDEESYEISSDESEESESELTLAFINS